MAPRRRPPSGAGRALKTAALLLFSLAALRAAGGAGDESPPPSPPPPPPPPSPSPPPSPEQQRQDPFDAAPACPTWPRASTAVGDERGRLWGFLEAQGVSCAYKDARTGAPEQLDAWETAYACGGGPSPSTSTRDGLGRLWGWDRDKGRSCAYKDAFTGRPLVYDTYEPGDWLGTPACPGAEAAAATAVFDELSVADSQFKTWSWGGYSDAPRLCAFKDDRQAPIPLNPSTYVRLSFVDAPACGGSETSSAAEPSPENSRPDRDGFLWGWERARPCAWKRVVRDAATGRLESTTPLYYSGMQGPRTAEHEPPTGGREGASPPPPPPSPSSSPPQMEVPPVNSEFRYRRSGEGGPTPSLRPFGSPAPSP